MKCVIIINLPIESTEMCLETYAYPCIFIVQRDARFEADFTPGARSRRVQYKLGPCVSLERSKIESNRDDIARVRKWYFKFKCHFVKCHFLNESMNLFNHTPVNRQNNLDGSKLKCKTLYFLTNLLRIVVICP